MPTIALVGYGAIGQSVLQLLQGDATIHLDQVIATERSLASARAGVAALFPQARVATQLALEPRSPDLLVECAGHQAIEQHVLPALEQGVSCLLVSIGALAEPGMVERLLDAAARGGSQLQLLPGAIGGIDALAAAKAGGLEYVTYTGAKPPLAWRGTPAEAEFDLDSLAEPTIIFEGSAREAARRFPKNANVAATVSLAGLGLDHTQVRLLADPSATENRHEVEANGAFGSFELILRGKPLAANPKTSALTVFSVVRGIRNRAGLLAI
ncbi:MAG: aspartate dehydrogenase [Pigmentiphaga sp.]|nr:aspartate dehydrogenase [Pigmentiphaga sp.]